ncbi:DNA polymerase III subunit gamma and tau [Nocardioides panacisoli]|uniref:DNA polymerase III subunit gamma/tau n=1 Tax=Nocardioides panacisoli TaxID=627624 RepID=A0ABP7IKI8_9ACTN
MESPLALYRRYRPETFAEVIGQEHVTEPLRAALAGNRVNHAYLFSGPRGCGKTTSARILARSLNCEQAPVADPCGECDSCRDLARGGPGSIDVIEIDAASHGGVDDARELREKAFFAPVKSRYKVYIIDEAHMVTTQGFNALLKLVEEPPPHLRFIFATTEPDKVIPTIRSRTHHYPFRLIPPRLLSSYLSELCEREGVTIEPTALPLVVRAGAGSARDTLSVLDQLLGGAGPDGVTYQLASGLLGYTPDTLLDDVVDAFAAGDGASVFGVVDRVIETGQDPRRFTEDLLRRLRDLVIVSAVPDAPASGLLDVAEDQGERLVAQAGRFGRSELTRAADLVATGLTDMRGATAPRLLLELICARILLPAADHSTEGLGARLDRLERRMSITGTPTAAPAVPEPAPVQDRPEPSRAERAAPERVEEVPEAPVAEVPVAEGPEAPVPPTPTPTPAPTADPEPPPAAAPTTKSSAGMSAADVRRVWPDVVAATMSLRKATWSLVRHNAQVLDYAEGLLTLGFASAGLRDQFVNGGHEPVLLQALVDGFGIEPKIEAIVDHGAAGTSTPAPARAAEPDGPPSWASGPEPPPEAAAQPEPPVSRRPPPEAFAPEQATASPEPAHDPDAAVDLDDAEADHESGAELLARELGAQVIDEIPRS